MDLESSSAHDGDIQGVDAVMVEAALTAAAQSPNGEPVYDTSGCSHLASAFSDPGTKAAMLKKYKAAVAWCAVNKPSTVRPTKRRKIQMPTCGTCNLTLVRPFICLECPYGGCWHDGHIRDHLKESEHGFCADVKKGYLFCAECDDFVYNRVVEDLFHSVTLSLEEKETKFLTSKKGREPYKPWIPDQKETAELAGMTALSCHGRRGLLNLGQTCFLNVILQALVHNPLLRNYFLSDRHNSRLCKTKDCMCCEMDKLFAEVFSGESQPYGPVTLLATTWRASAELAGYAQHDAHEFFISALNQIHMSSRGSTNISCNCVIHNVFAGSLQSDVRCDKCGNVVSTVDPTLDISLELKGKATEHDNTLTGCLRRYTQQEKLSSKYSCSQCGVTTSSATKRLSIRKLPPVLSFQLKRFEHKAREKATAKKIDAHIRFPATLNMAPYTTLVAGMQNKENEKSGKMSEVNTGPDVLYEYDLFAVINHEGQIDNGHYTNYARSQDEWYRFDDDKVTHSTLDAALKSAAYMCFYAKRHLDYKPYTRPSYVLTRETEAVKEKEKEKELEAARMKEVEDALLATV